MRTPSSMLFVLLGLVLVPAAACGGGSENTAGTVEPATPAPDPEGAGGEQAGTRCGGIAGLACGSGEFCDLGASCQMPDAMGTCREARQVCTREYRPVCGCDGRTHPTACVAHAAGVSVLHDGECPGGEPEAEPPSAAGASCGSRGQAPCAEGTVCIRPSTANCGETDMPGTCQVRPQMCPMNFDPVCGCDGHTYSNTCAAAAAGASVRARGECH